MYSYSYYPPSLLTLLLNQEPSSSASYGETSHWDISSSSNGDNNISSSSSSNSWRSQPWGNIGKEEIGIDDNVDDAGAGEAGEDGDDEKDSDSDSDESSMQDEVEVIYELDAAAMAELPLHLQSNMRELQIERLRRHQDAGLAIQHGEDFFMGFYAELWYRDRIARLVIEDENSWRLYNDSTVDEDGEGQDEESQHEEMQDAQSQNDELQQEEAQNEEMPDEESQHEEPQYDELQYDEPKHEELQYEETEEKEKKDHYDNDNDDEESETGSVLHHRHSDSSLPAKEEWGMGVGMGIGLGIEMGDGYPVPAHGRNHTISTPLFTHYEEPDTRQTELYLPDPFVGSSTSMHPNEDGRMFKKHSVLDSMRVRVRKKLYRMSQMFKKW
ncbi:hypothetical protein ASPWEDRAFT_66961 [Aspergillus wentii DTO 134E9]|uniref:Uncharacterized protein n=1 Tax=Aspergillus wentii DTO 134E9 TaxID=1073089 RepID=A0A1L9RNY5_ASPWE|nr:uncharacterized protein ASPWEDRAFT_66961 [Aspergillus wentii DTO 134E9]KAI9934278.1 hypothetical protein MW887_005352 [Aspergillus wentii]OJJ36583.1 hypothetical protein ASPWEDRAFT_66961 [Aspergillus wentii DTO 134E9]